MPEQIKITILCGEGKIPRVIRHDTGKTLLETMRAEGMALPSLCGGMGTCGRCMVKFCGYAPLPTASDRRMVLPDRLREGFRLSCTARPVKECTVEADFAKAVETEERRIHVLAGYELQTELESETETGLKSEAEAGLESETESEAEQAGTLSGNGTEHTPSHPAATGGRTVAAADIGTTTIAMQLLDGESGSVLDTYTCINPQRGYGTDVVSRIRASDAGQGEILQKLVRDALANGLYRFRQRAESLGVRAPELLAVACNTVMGHIFMGYPTQTLGRSPFCPVNLKTDMLEWNGIRTVLLPNLSAFVGGDILAGLYACGLCGGVPNGTGKAPYACIPDGGRDGDKAWLFMDLGTNAEMVMGAGDRVAATAAAAGPAFEGRGRDGAMGAERILAVAHLLEQGVLDETGLLAEPYFGTGITVETGSRKVFLTQEDIRDIQTAKAAVRAGIHFLAERLGIAGDCAIGQVYIAGGMGFYLDGKAAVGLGLLPEAFAGRLRTVGNTALAGAGLFARNGWQESGRMLEDYGEKVEVFQMAEIADFAEVYMGYVDFPAGRHGKA